MASTTFDFPQPLGPTMQVVPVPLKVTTVRSQKDLKPTISTLRSLSKVSPFVVNFYFAMIQCAHFSVILEYRSRRGFRAKRDDFPFLEGRSVHATLLSVTDREQTRLAGSRSEPSRLALRWRYGTQD